MAVEALPLSSLVEPHAIVFGVPRCGTTALYRFLAAHPQVAASERKELNFFLNDLQDEPVEQRLAKYRGHFGNPETGSSLTLEASPAYAQPVDRLAIMQRITATLPGVRLIVVLRDPSERLETHFRGLKERTDRLHDETTFEQFVELGTVGGDISRLAPDEGDARKTMVAFELGHYDELLRDYLDHFDPESVLPVFSDSLKNAPLATMGRVCHFLGIDSTFYEDFVFTEENKTKSVRWSPLYRLALALNRRAELVLNRFPAVRRAARRIHALLNEDEGGGAKMSAQVERQLASYYAPHLAGLRDVLGANYPELEMPGWLMSDGKQD
jgi:hypothetical protein